MRPGFAFFVAFVALFAVPSAWARPNPASVFCVQNGGRSEIRSGPRGQYRVCRLPNGRVVDEWAYYRAMRGERR
jgi:putative hemolysin